MAEKLQPAVPHAQRRYVGRVASGVVAAAALGLPALLALIPGVAVGYVVYLVCLGLIYAIVALGLNLLIGFAGQFSLGHAAFLALGAYGTALLTTRLHVPFVVALPVAGLFTALVGFLLALPALRLSGPYLAVVTLGFGLAVPQLIIYFNSLTGGSSGLNGVPLPAIPIWYDRRVGLYTYVLRTDSAFYYVVLLVLALLTMFAFQLVNSRTGRAFIAIRDSELAAQAMGVHLVRYKTMAFAISALYAGIAGGLYVNLLHGVGPEDFTLFLSIAFLTMIVVGGLGSISGSLLGAFVLTALQNLLTRLPVVRDFKNLYLVVLGAVLICTILFLPQGLISLFRQRERRRQVEAPAGDVKDESGGAVRDAGMAPKTPEGAAQSVAMAPKAGGDG
ncbi:MAG: branched-chain amino acid ABC transporter permease [Herpetosiphon sp.]